MNIIKPIRDFKSYSLPIAQAIYKTLYDNIYASLLEIVKNREVVNATFTPLEDALRRGVMEYREGYFVGSLTASISKELRGLGAVFNHTRKVYYLDISRLPQNILQAIAAGNQSSKTIIDKVNAYLRAIEGRDIASTNIDPFFAEILSKLEKQFYSTTRAITSADLEIGLNPKFADNIKVAYTQNLDKYIRGWAQEAILRLREKVEKNVQQGFRAERLVSMIKTEAGVSQRKAKFLAYQETSLMTASYREIRYKDIGVEKYMWSTSHDERVRPDHRILQGKIFYFDHPPVTNQSTGAKNNPGEDYNCRCVSIPVLSRGVNMVQEYAKNK